MRTILLMLGLLLSGWLFAVPVLGQELTPQLDGEVVPVDVSTPEFQPIESTKVVQWQHEFDTWSGSESLRLHFADIIVPDGADVTLLIRNITGSIIDSYDAERLRQMSDQWSLAIPGDYALLSLMAPASPVGLSLKVDAVAHTIWPGHDLSIIGPSNLQPIRDYAKDALVSGLSRAVAKLSFIEGTSAFVCTGFLITDELLMTNEHCVNTPALCATTIAYFGFELRPDGFVDPGRQFRCSQLVAVNHQLDFAVLRIAQSPGATYGKLSLSPQVLSSNEAAFIVEHPAGRAKEIALHDCRLVQLSVPGNAPGTDLSHSCDTEGGSSGSPVFTAQGKVIALHHFGIGGAFPDRNRAVLMTRILADLHAKGVL